MNIKNLLNRYQEIEQQIYNYFGYEEEWRKMPLDDCTEYFWCFDGNGNVHYCEAKNKTLAKEIIKKGEHSYSDKIRKNIIHIKCDLTLICLNTNCDFNVFLSIFDNSKEIKSIKS